MTNRKVTSKKTGNGSRRTTTLSSTNGKTESYSNKPTKQSPRRTVSFNHKTGKSRTTYSQKLGGGYTRITSKTTGGSKKYKHKSNSGSVSVLLTFPLLLLILLCGTIMYLWPITIPYIIGAVIAIVTIVVVINLIIIILPWVVLGGILYGLVYLIGVFV